jgi:hypothetical protein
MRSSATAVSADAGLQSDSVPGFDVDTEPRSVKDRLWAELLVDQTREHLDVRLLEAAHDPETPPTVGRHAAPSRE